jgi:hypothetical protein
MAPSFSRIYGPFISVPWECTLTDHPGLRNSSTNAQMRSFGKIG